MLCAVGAQRETKLEARVAAAAAAALARQDYVTAIDVLTGLGWLAPVRVDDWRHRRIPFLEAGVQAGLPKIAAAMRVFRAWATSAGLRPSETAYVARSVGREPLQFSKSGEPAIERGYRTHWISPALSEEFESLVMRAMSKDRDDRYTSCEALLVDLNALLDDPSHSTERARITSTGKKPAPRRSNSKIAIWVAAIAATLAALIAVVSVMMKTSEVKPAKPEVQAVVPPADARVAEPVQPPAGAAPAQPRTVEYQILSSPPGAKIWEGGRDLGATPTTYKAMRDKDERIKLVASLDGYNDTEFFINAALDSADKPVTVTLVKPKKGAAPRIIKRPATTPKEGEKPSSAAGGELGGHPLHAHRETRRCLGGGQHGTRGVQQRRRGGEPARAQGVGGQTDQCVDACLDVVPGV